MADNKVKNSALYVGPALRFNQFNKRWLKATLGEYYNNMSTGMTPSRLKPKYFRGDIPWITSGELNYGYIHKTTESITKEAVEKTNLKIYPANTLFIAITGLEAPGTRGKCAINAIPATTNQSCLAFEENNKISSQFLFQWYKREGIRLYYRFAQGTKQQSFNNRLVKKFQFYVPGIDEQQKIASFLSAVDKKIQLLEKKKALLEEYKKGVMQKLFSQEIRFKDEVGKDFPDWQEVVISKIGQTYNGLTGKSGDDFGQGKAYIQYKQIFDDSKINTGNCRYVDISDEEKQNQVQFGDVFFTTSSETPNEIATSSVLLESVGEMYLNSFCFGFRPNFNRIFPMYARYLFRSELFRRRVLPLAQGSTRYNISKTSFIKLTIPLPCIKEQERIAEFLDAIDLKVYTIYSQIEGNQQFKKGLLQQMFV